MHKNLKITSATDLTYEQWKLKNIVEKMTLRGRPQPTMRDPINFLSETDQRGITIMECGSAEYCDAEEYLVRIPGIRAVKVHDNNRTIATILRLNRVCSNDVVINFARYAIKRGWKSIHVSDDRHYTCLDSRSHKNTIIVGNAAMNPEQYSETIICGHAWLYQPYSEYDDR